MFAIVDYGVGNLFSLKSSLGALGYDAQVTGDADALRRADKVLLPGVGAFGDAMDKLRAGGLAEVVREVAEKGTPLLGICLGMQLLFEESCEFGSHRGLGLIKGAVRPLQPALQALGLDYKVPHMGWNSLELVRPEDPLLKNTREGDYVYYVHSFYATGCEEALLAVSDYGVKVPGAVRRENIWGTQFHPEKSGGVGLAMLRAFMEVA